MTVIVCLSCSLVKRDLWVVYFPNHVQQSYFNLICECFAVPYMCVCVHVRACVRTSVSVCVCARVITHAVISGKPPFTPAEMKGFPLSQSSFFVSMVLWFCQNPRENRGGGGGGGKKKKKINVPHHPTTAGCHHASTHTYTCIDGQWAGGIEKKSCICYMNLVIWSWKVKQKFSCLRKQ